MDVTRQVSLLLDLRHRCLLAWSQHISYTIIGSDVSHKESGFFLLARTVPCFRKPLASGIVSRIAVTSVDPLLRRYKSKSFGMPLEAVEVDIALGSPLETTSCLVFLHMLFFLLSSLGRLLAELKIVLKS